MFVRPKGENMSTGTTVKNLVDQLIEKDAKYDNKSICKPVFYYER